jgi:hypothetical protein
MTSATTSSAEFDRALGRITAHLRAHVAEVRRLERAGAAPGEIEERRELIARLQCHLERGRINRCLASGYTRQGQPRPLAGPRA